ncbi:MULTISPECIES: zinc-ribbon domain-containing protein [Methanobacterium]|uniref:Uncharacterized protein n=1 Tax=Methanobacterium bryantii TaxID=2161 RepID=A0A2A2HAG6_METBR|nr:MULTISPECIES: zinc ribbon domain-containing protein [Methanobacterium]OEC88478.1 hypothetical protein A9507_04290 [Methanobacterium sp. A39]PAV06367.1 hypothetical protein ASJ80_16235 [Methanobacterium bryantii]
MFCRKCGAENKKDAKFCKKCGINLNDDSKITKENTGSPVKFLIVICFVLVAGLGIAAGNIFHDPGVTSNSSGTNQQSNSSTDDAGIDQQSSSEEKVVCELCGGTGVCCNCGGDGVWGADIPCTMCWGTGVCPACNGTGYTIKRSSSSSSSDDNWQADAIKHWGDTKVDNAKTQEHLAEEKGHSMDYTHTGYHDPDTDPYYVK